MEKKQSQESTSDRFSELYRRPGIRWTMVFYDTVFYLFCWLVESMVRPYVFSRMSTTAILVSFFVGYGLFFLFRVLLESYYCIFRYGYTFAFAREVLADLLASASFLLVIWVLSDVLSLFSITLSVVLYVAVTYTSISIFSRFVYCYLYRFAKGEGVLPLTVRKLLTWFAFVDFHSLEPGATVQKFFEPVGEDVGPINDLLSIVEKFSVQGDVVSVKKINRGYINQTYRIETLSRRGNVHKYLLQRINTNVFPPVEELMENYQLTTAHLHKHLKLFGNHKRGSVQMIRPLKEGGTFLQDPSGCWRMLTYFDNTYSMDIPDHPDTFYYAGVAFGRFIKEMAKLEVESIKEVIPNFHNTESRYRDLEKAIELDPRGRVSKVKAEIRFLRERADRFGMISTALAEGRIPTRICHNDTNLNNILFDVETHLPVAIIDLDTVMPSSPLYDFGDSMRIGTNTARDDEKDLEKVSCNLSLYEKYARGYLEACGDILTKEELELLPYAALIITAEDGIRFLMDHINGDVYYNIYYPGQNLDRARTQLKLLEDMEKKLPEIKRILLKIYGELGLSATISL